MKTYDDVRDRVESLSKLWGYEPSIEIKNFGRHDYLYYWFDIDMIATFQEFGDQYVCETYEYSFDRYYRNLLDSPKEQRNAFENFLIKNYEEYLIEGILLSGDHETSEFDYSADSIRE
jgi:hypothetical protein